MADTDILRRLALSMAAKNKGQPGGSNEALLGSFFGFPRKDVEYYGEDPRMLPRFEPGEVGPSTSVMPQAAEDVESYDQADKILRSFLGQGYNVGGTMSPAGHRVRITPKDWQEPKSGFPLEGLEEYPPAPPGISTEQDWGRPAVTPQMAQNPVIKAALEQYMKYMAQQQAIGRGPKMSLPPIDLASKPKGPQMNLPPIDLAGQ